MAMNSVLLQMVTESERKTLARQNEMRRLREEAIHDPAFRRNSGLRRMVDAIRASLGSEA
jgi:hypothetical protein